MHLGNSLLLLQPLIQVTGMTADLVLRQCHLLARDNSCTAAQPVPASVRLQGQALMGASLCWQVFAGLLVGAMLPYWFSAMTMKSVGKAALAMVQEVRRQFNTIPGLMDGSARPDYRLCVEISTAVSPCAALHAEHSIRCVHCGSMQPDGPPCECINAI